MYYNRITGETRNQRPATIRLGDIGYPRPSEAIYAAAGWVPVTPFVTPEGMAKIAGTQSVVWDGTTATEHWQFETLEAAQERQEAAELAATQRRAWALSSDLVTAYEAFHAAYSQAVAAAIAAGAEISQSVTYQALVAALNALEGDQWTRVALQLSQLWNVVVVHCGGNMTKAYQMLPLLEFRRENPPPEIDPEEGGEV